MKCRREVCSNDVEQIPGSHRARAYCCDNCRINDFKDRRRRAELEKARLEELERQRVKWDKLTEAQSDLLPDQIELLFDHAVDIPREAVIRAFDQLFEYASATFEQRKAIIRARLMLLGEDLGYPAIAGVGVGDGIAAGDEWWHRFAITRRGDELLPAYREVFYHHRLVRLEREREERERQAAEERRRSEEERKQYYAAYYSERRG
jgi:hypothetical protein